MEACSTYIEAIARLEALIPPRDSLKLVKTEAAAFAKAHTPQECFDAAQAFYASENFQIQEVGVFLAGYAARQCPAALTFLQTTVSVHPSWKVQETLAMAFDLHCRAIGYAAALPLIQTWLGHPRPNVRRAASEGLRVWTSRPYFKDHPEHAVALLAARRTDESEYVRKSIGNALRDISKKHGPLVAAELAGWDISDRRVRQVYKRAGKFLESAQEKE